VNQLRCVCECDWFQVTSFDFWSSYIYSPEKFVDPGAIVVDAIWVDGTSCVELPMKHSIAQSVVFPTNISIFS
jgi:hypothetical protein